MKAQINKILSIAIVVLFVTSALFTIVPNAAAVRTFDTHAFVALAPSVIGLGQSVDVVVFIPEIVPIATQNTSDLNAGEKWENLSVTITRPDGTTETKGPFRSDATGSAYFLYTPTMLGNYTFVMTYPGQTVKSGDIYKASTSQPAILNVRDELAPTLPFTPLPTEYWTNPINAENKGWNTLQGSWVMPSYDSMVTMPSGRYGYNPYSSAPNSAHIMWTKPLNFGGIAGGQSGDDVYFSGQSYQFMLQPPVVIADKLYYNIYSGTTAASGQTYGFVCVDLNTGQTVWTKNGTITNGQILAYNSPNQHGNVAYLWNIGGSTWQMFDAFTGNWMLDLKGGINGVTALSGGTGVPAIGPNGELLMYILDGKNNYLAMWNSSKALANIASAANYWNPASGTYNWSLGIQYNVTIPDIPGTQLFGRYLNQPDTILAESADLTTAPPVYTQVAYRTSDGTQLWVQNRTNIGDQWMIGTRNYNSFMANNAYVFYERETQKYHAIDVTTGKEIWTSTRDNNAWGVYYGGNLIVNNTYIATTFDGYVMAFDLKTGAKLWSYYSGDAGFATAYGHWPFYNGMAAADSKIFVGTGEHSPDASPVKGNQLFALNTQTGELVWKISANAENPIVADGKLMFYNGYDNQLYCFARGPSAMTVEAPITSIASGTSVVIRGTVTDIAAGTAQTEQAGRFPNGVPCVSDDSQSQWMEYVYMQQQKPTNATGVQVNINVVDSNGNYRTIGTTTSDDSGMFTYSWTPDITGSYKVIASFAGSESYYPSSAETSFTVEQTATTPQPTQAPSAADLYFVPAIVGVIIAIIVVGAVLALLVTKKP